uniref:Uncharacterized protein n=1 Tax=Triticum urartu TaxID=4572 RepID=A0A8R7UE99_TRIUA
ARHPPVNKAASSNNRRDFAIRSSTSSLPSPETLDRRSPAFLPRRDRRIQGEFRRIRPPRARFPALPASRRAGRCRFRGGRGPSTRWI